VDIDLRGPRLTTQPRDFTTRESLRHERLKAKAHGSFFSSLT
jgi:hypothetical protein